jgi:phosphohistidine phosphatase
MQIHLFSSAGEQGIEYILEAARAILADKPKPIVAYLSAANVSYLWVRETRKAFRGLARVKVIDVARQPLARILATLDRADLLYIPGGNTYLLAKCLHAVRVPKLHQAAGAADLITEIRQRVLVGLPLVCSSAGSVLCGPDILTTNDANECECADFEGLDLLPFNLSVHFPNKPGEERQAREERLQEFLTLHPERYVLALEDGAYLRVAHDAIQVVRGYIWEVKPGEAARLLHTAASSPPPINENRPVEARPTPAQELARVEEEAPGRGEKTMKTLLILRHAKSSWKDESLPDHDRPLNKRGKQDAPRMGKLLRDEGLIPDLILSSDARRARATIELVAQECRYDGEIVFLRELYAAEPEAYLEALAQRGGDAASVMIVGHNPGLEELLEELTGERLPLPTAALAQVTLPIEHWSELGANARDDMPQGKLVNLWRPKDL